MLQQGYRLVLRDHHIFSQLDVFLRVGEDGLTNVAWYTAKAHRASFGRRYSRIKYYPS